MSLLSGGNGGLEAQEGWLQTSKQTIILSQDLKYGIVGGVEKREAAHGLQT